MSRHRTSAALLLSVVALGCGPVVKQQGEVEPNDDVVHCDRDTHMPERCPEDAYYSGPAQHLPLPKDDRPQRPQRRPND